MMRAVWVLVMTMALGAAAVAARPKLGAPSPAYSIRLVDGSTLSSDALRGQVVVLNFWATWCVPCRKELPLLDAYYRAMNKHGLRVFAVTTEGSVPLSKMKALFEVLAIQPARSIGGGYAALNAVPTNYIIDRAGIVRYAKAGAFDLDDLNRELVPLLREPAPTSPAPGPVGG